MAKVFLSSTRADLGEYRPAAFDLLRRLGHEPSGIEGIEMLQASDVDPVLTTAPQISGADLFIVIVARRYGRIAANERVSLVEAEYELAKKAARPVLAFLLDDSASWPVGGNEPEQPLLRPFRQRLMDERVVTFFDSLPDFLYKLESAMKAWETARAARPTVEVTLDDLPLAWRLVAASFAEPELLHHLDPSAFVAGIEKWEEANNADKNQPWPSRLDRACQALDSAQTDHEASALWLAWMRATRPAKAAGKTDRSDGTAQ